jgi:hypothetical protein
LQRLSSLADRFSCAILSPIRLHWRRRYHYGMAKSSTSAATRRLAAQLENEAKQISSGTSALCSGTSAPMMNWLTLVQDDWQSGVSSQPCVRQRLCCRLSKPTWRVAFQSLSTISGVRDISYSGVRGMGYVGLHHERDL